ncbi:helix-turn-helix domain-containing protein [Chromobacterium violaceum]|uniref:helix-turn-helix domain-containing protein n=1 Tax=Chromobacterium violaceum TaxID=536 RepID=UPI00096FAC0C|nr:helix-turn-helix transcriptional regulator [Chromobacterium violaceum]OLZ73716.1 hypothetical protein BS642_20560 [Chromobacterium violaceum]
MELKPLYGEEAQAIRKRCGLTQDQLGELIERSRVQVGRYEKVGQEVPTLVALAYRGLDALWKEQNATAKS